MDKQTFKILFDKYFDQVRRHIYYKCGDTELSTDIAQETFMRIWDKQIEPEQGLEMALLYRISTNLFISKTRRDQTAMNYLQALKLKNEETNPLNQLEYEETKQKYERALIRLSEKQRTVFLMSRTEGLSYAEISKQLSIGVKAVEKRMSQALAALRQELL